MYHPIHMTASYLGAFYLIKNNYNQKININSTMISRKKEVVNLCGICGVIEKPGSEVNTLMLRTMTNAMHRGPDDERYLYAHLF